MSDQFRLFVVGETLNFHDGRKAVAGFVESSDHFVTVRIRFSTAEAMREYSTGAGLRVGDMSLNWDSSIGGGGPLAAVAELVFLGTLPNEVASLNLSLKARDGTTQTFRLALGQIICEKK